MRIVEWLRRPWQGSPEARAALAGARAAEPSVSELSAGLRKLEQENHIAAKVRRLANGERP